MKLQTVVWNGIIAALYVAVSFVIQPFGFGAIQFRASEIFNHLVVFNKKYFFGIVIGVFFANLLLSPMAAYDIVFGVGQSALALLTTIIAMRWIKGVWARMAFNTIVFTITMFLIAYELYLVFELPFWLTYLTTAISEFIILVIGAPIMYALNKRLNFAKKIS